MQHLTIFYIYSKLCFANLVVLYFIWLTTNFVKYVLLKSINLMLLKFTGHIARLAYKGNKHLKDY